MKGFWGSALLVFLLTAHVCATPEQKTHYENAPGFAFVYAHEDGECFVDVDSIRSEEYSPPRYQIGATTYYASDSSPTVSVRYITFRYNYDKQTVFFLGMDGRWYWLNPDENPISMCQIQLADYLFLQCYQIHFIH